MLGHWDIYARWLGIAAPLGKGAKHTPAHLHRAAGVLPPCYTRRPGVFRRWRRVSLGAAFSHGGENIKKYASRPPPRPGRRAFNASVPRCGARPPPLRPSLGAPGAPRLPRRCGAVRFAGCGVSCVARRFASLVRLWRPRRFWRAVPFRRSPAPPAVRFFPRSSRRGGTPPCGAPVSLLSCACGALAAFGRAVPAE